VSASLVTLLLHADGWGWDELALLSAGWAVVFVIIAVTGRRQPRDDDQAEDAPSGRQDQNV
jgi:hypothetical protein